jgi:cytochrome P450
MSSASLSAVRTFRPPAPTPNRRRLGPIQLLTALRRNPLECWSEEHFEKPIVRGGLPLGEVLVLNEPSAIKRVLLDNTDNYRKDNFQRRILAAGLGEGLLSAEGSRWRTQRRVLAPLFSARVVKNFSREMVTVANELVHRLREPASSVADVAAEMSRATLEVLGRTIFSEGLARDPEQFRKAMTIYFETIGRISVLDVLGLPTSVPRLAQLKVRSTLRFFMAAIEEMITVRKQLLERGKPVPHDLLSLLLKARDPETGAPLTDNEIRSNILTFISAGHETTANAITWTLYLLSQSKGWLARVETEVESQQVPLDGSADDLPVTRACVDEAIRLYPPIAAISRVANGPDKLGDEAVRRGTLVVIAPYVLHRHRLLWSDPNLYDPARFLPGARSSIARFTYLPFGAGPRTCIGSSFALQETTAFVANIIKNFEIQLSSEHSVWPLMRVTLRPAGGLPMTLKRRRCEGKASIGVL